MQLPVPRAPSWLLHNLCAHVDQVTYLYLHRESILSFEERIKRSNVGGQ